MKAYQIHHFVRSEDLNSHRTLFAGQAAKWFVESGFIAAASITSPHNIVCLNIHGMLFKTPVPTGSIICFESKVVLARRVSLVSYVKATNGVSGQFLVDGFLTFVHVNADGKPIAHGVTVEPDSEEEKRLNELARSLPKR
jgi:acyl-CoA hydrolase